MEVDVAVGRREEGKKGRREEGKGDGTGALHDFSAGASRIGDCETAPS
jgi:hypothetical protein